MIYALLGFISSTVLFLFLYLRSVIAYNKLKTDIALLNKNVDIVYKQLNIAALPPISPEGLAKQMKEGNL